MERKTFVLANKKTYRRPVKVFVKDGKGILSERWLTFTTEHLINKEARHTNGRNVAAEFVTGDPVELNALYSNTAYGIDFYEKGDEKGLKKAAGQNLTTEDFEKMAIKSLFESADLIFDTTKSIGLLKAEYKLYLELKSGKKIVESPAKEIVFKKVDVGAEIESQKQDARDFYEDQYGEKVPDIVWNDTGFLDGLSNPNFDAKKYISEKEGYQKIEESIPPAGEPVNEKETLHTAYFEKFSKRVPNMKSNDLGWIKSQLEK